MKRHQNSAVVVLLVYVAAAFVACAPQSDSPLTHDSQPAVNSTIVPIPAATASPAVPSITAPPPALSPTAAPTSAPSAPLDSNAAGPLPLTPAQIARLGGASGPYAAARPIVLERFQDGVMLIFAKSDKGFDASGSEFIFALAKNGLAFRIADTFRETSKNSDTWYTCDARPGQRPEKSGIPWRGFGKAWCEHPQVRAALGNARSYEESDLTAAFQPYALGRAFQVPDWRGIPGWDAAHVYVVYLENTATDFASGRWE